MSTELFNRVCTLAVKKKTGELINIDGLRISFEINKTEKECSAKVTVSNLSEKTSSGFENGDFLTLTAGYVNYFGVIFSGDVSQVKTTRTATGRDTVFECRSGSNIRGKHISISFVAGSSAKSILSELANKSGLHVEKIGFDTIQDNPYQAGFAISGDYYSALKQVANRIDCVALVSDGVLYIQPKAVKTPERLAAVLSGDTGLLGFPERSKTEVDKKEVYGWSLNALLFHNARVGGSVKVISKEIQGNFFRVKEVKHAGDTHGNSFGTSLKVVDI